MRLPALLGCAVIPSVFAYPLKYGIRRGVLHPARRILSDRSTPARDRGIRARRRAEEASSEGNAAVDRTDLCAGATARANRKVPRGAEQFKCRATGSTDRTYVCRNLPSPNSISRARALADG